MQPDKIGLWKGPDTRSKCVVTMNPTQAGQSGVVGTRSAPLGSPRTSGAPKRVLLGPKRTLFACFLELGGSIWDVLDASRPVSAVPGAQRGPKGAPKMRIVTFWPF